MKSIYKQIMLWAGTLTLSTGVAFAAFFDYTSLNKNSNPGSGNDSNNTITNPVVETPSQKLLASIMNINKASIDGGISIKQDNSEINLDVDGALLLDINNLDNIRFEGDLVADINGINAKGKINYFENKIYFDYENSKLSLKTDSILDFVEMIPNYGFDLALPSELTNFDLNAIVNQINSMEPEEVSGGYMFRFDLSDTIEIVLKSDKEYNFTGFRTNNFYFKDTYINLDFDIDEKNSDTITFIDPNIAQYQDFEPAFDLVNVLYNAFNKSQNTLNLSINIDNLDKAYLNLDADISFDSSLSKVELNGTVNEVNFNRSHKFLLGTQDSNLFVNYNNLKLSIENQNINMLLNYLLGKVGDEYLTDGLNSITGLLEDFDIEGLMNNLTSINNLIKDIKVSEESLDIYLNLDSLGLEAGDIILNFAFNKEEFKGINIVDLNIGGYLFDFSLKVKPYEDFNFNKEEYVAIDPALCLVDSVLALSNEHRFRLDFDASIDDKASENDISVNGGLQFDIEKKYGYGELDLTDASKNNHNIKVDMRSYDEILFKYNENLKGRFSSSFFTDVFSMVQKILNNKDDHFYELFGDMLNDLSTLPLMEAINNNDYGQLFEIGLIDSFNVTNNKIELVLSAGLLGIDSTIKLELGYDSEASSAKGILKYFKVSDFEYDGNVYNFQVNLTSFDDSLEDTRLHPGDNYIEFDSLAVLLQLGINTSRYNHYHFNGTVNLNLGRWNLTEIPLDLKVYNDKGNVSVDAEISKVPIVPILSTGKSLSLRNRSLRVYYKDGYIYINRKEEFFDGALFWGKWKPYEVYVKADINTFLDNIVYYLCNVGLGFSEDIISQDSSSSDDSSSDDSTIHFENIIKAYSYNDSAENENSYFALTINTEELLKTSVLGDVNLKVNVNDDTQTLYGIDLGFKLVSILDANASFVLDDLGEEFNLDSMNDYLANHKGDTDNQLYEVYWYN